MTEISDTGFRLQMIESLIDIERRQRERIVDLHKEAARENQISNYRMMQLEEEMRASEGHLHFLTGWFERVKKEAA